MDAARRLSWAAGPGLTLAGPTASHYQIAYPDGTFTVNKAATTLVTAPHGLLYATLSATLTRSFDSAPLPGRTIVFSISGRTVCTATTNTSGVATCRFLGVSLSGSYNAYYAGDANTLPRFTGQALLL